MEKKWIFVLIAWLISCLATAGSLFFSEVMKFPPCVLCWYQRIGMYPLVFILLVGLFPVSKAVVKFALPLAVSGWIVALYHNLLYYKIIPESAAPCVRGVSCSAVFINWFGFVTIPLLSFVAFSLIVFFLILTYRTCAHEK